MKIYKLCSAIYDELEVLDPVHKYFQKKDQINNSLEKDDAWHEFAVNSNLCNKFIDNDSFSCSMTICENKKRLFICDGDPVCFWCGLTFDIDIKEKSDAKKTAKFMIHKIKEQIKNIEFNREIKEQERILNYE